MSGVWLRRIVSPFLPLLIDLLLFKGELLRILKYKSAWVTLVKVACALPTPVYNVSTGGGSECTNSQNQNKNTLTCLSNNAQTLSLSLSLPLYLVSISLSLPLYA